MNASHLKALFEQRSGAAEELRALVEAAEGRSFNAEEQATEARVGQTLTELDGQIASGLAALEREKRADDARSRFESLGVDVHRTADDVEARSFAGKVEQLLSGEIRSLDLPVPEFRGVDADMTGYVDPKLGEPLLPKTVAATLVNYVRERSTVMRARAQVIQTEGGAPVSLPRVTELSVAQIVGETQPIPVSSPRLGVAELGAFKYAFLVPVSSELLQDMQPPAAVDWLIRQGADALADGTGAAFIAGSGNAEPEGVVTGATQTVTAGAAASLGLDDLLDAMFAVPAPYRANGTFVVNDASLGALRKLTGTDGRFLWEPSAQLGGPDRLLGHAIETDPAMPTVGAGNRSVVFGDLARAYVVRIAGGARIERSDEFRWSEDVSTWRFILRADGAVVDERAVAVVEHPAS